MSILVAGATPSEGFELKSVRLNNEPPVGSSPQHLRRLKSASDPDGWQNHGNLKTWTISFWMKWDNEDNGGSQAERWIYWVDGDGINSMGYDHIGLHNGQLRYYCYVNSWSTLRARIHCNRTLRDPAAWHHCMVVMDSTLATAADRTKIYINGERETSLQNVTQIAQNADTNTNMNANTRIGTSHSVTTTESYGGYLSEFYRIDGQALGPEYFGETNVITNQWQPKNPTDIKETLTFGVNGFYLPFSNDALATSFTDADYHVPHTGFTAVGTTHTDTAVKKFGTASMQLDGNSDYLSIPDHADWALGTGDFTLEAWVYNTTASGIQRLFSHTAHNVTGQQGFNVYLDSGGSGRFTWSTNGTNEYSWNFANCMDQNTWTHFALSRTGTTLRAFKNGVMVDSTVNSNMTTIYGGGKPLYIGAMNQSNSSTTGYFAGYIDEVRFSSINRYSAGFTVPTAAYTADKDTKLLLHMDGSNDGTTFTDSSWTGTGGTGHSITPNGDTKNERIQPNARMVSQGAVHIIGPKIGSSAIAFDGTGDYLTVPDSTDWDLGTGEFTVECWVNFHTKTNVGFVSKLNGTGGAHSWSLFWTNENLYWYGNGSGGTNLNEINFSWSPTEGKWYHIAAVRVGNTTTLYADGTSIGSATTSWNNDAGTSDLLIGREDNVGNTNDFNGYMDEIRVSNVARYTANFTPDTTAFTSDANTKLLIHSNTTMGSTTFDDSGATDHTISVVGNTKHVAPKIGTGLGVWDGVLSPATYIETVDAPSTWAFGTEDFTWDFWAYSDGWTNNETFYEAYAASTDRWELRIKTAGDLALTSVVGGSTVVDLNFNNANMPTGAWFHLEISRSGSTFRCFINGTETGDAQTSSGSLGTAGRQLKIGRSGRLNTVWKGYMDEHRISKGIVRHTSNFTPSTTAFKDDKDTVLLMHMDGGGGINPATNLPTLAGQGTYFWDASTNAIFYGADGIPTNKSLISFDGTGDYLSVPDSTDWDFGSADFTLECWVNVNAIPDQPRLFGDSGGNWYFRIGDCGGLKTISAYNGNWFCDDQHGDVSLGIWNHFAWSRASGTNRFFFNGNLITDSTITNASMSTTNLYIGGGVSSQDLDGYMDQIRVSSNARYTATFTPSTTPFTADANTKLLIQSDFSEGGLGADHSNNYNYFTPQNLDVGDSTLDSPMNNFCTVNPLSFARHGNTTALWGRASEGNLRWTSAGGQWGGHTFFSSTMAMPPNTGKWYWEMCDIGNAGVGSHSNFCWGIGLMPTDDGPNTEGHLGKNNNPGSSSGAWFIKSNSEVGTVRNYGGSASSENRTVPTQTTGPHVYKCCYDSDAGKFYFGGDLGWTAHDTVGASNIITSAFPSSSQYLFTGLNSYTVTPCYHAYQATSFSNNQMNFGQDASFSGAVEGTPGYFSDGNDIGEFYYEPPAGYVALCTANLPEPSIALPEKHFNTVTYTGTGSELAVTGVGFQPDFTWIKTRALTYNHRVFDALRGVTKEVYTNVTNAEVTDTQSLKSFDSDGFTLGTSSGVNPSNTMISWNWNCPTTFDPTSAGTIATATGRSNTTAGFSIVKYTGENAVKTIGHGLSVAPGLILVKNLALHQWECFYLRPDGSDGVLFLDQDGTGEAAGSGYWNDTNPTASVFTVGTGSGTGGATTGYIAYCFHSVEGYSKVGFYTGNSNTDGPFVYTGFKPAFLMVKLTTAASGSWVMFDNKRDIDNPTDRVFYANINAISTDVSSYSPYDLLSNGFKSRIPGGNGNEASYNSNGQTYLYLAFAESPFKTSNAR